MQKSKYFLFLKKNTRTLSTLHYKRNNPSSMMPNYFSTLRPEPKCNITSQASAIFTTSLFPSTVQICLLGIRKQRLQGNYFHSNYKKRKKVRGRGKTILIRQVEGSYFISARRWLPVTYGSFFISFVSSLLLLRTFCFVATEIFIFLIFLLTLALIKSCLPSRTTMSEYIYQKRWVLFPKICEKEKLNLFM